MRFSRRFGKRVVVGLLVVLFAFPKMSFGDWVPGSFMVQALARMMASVLEASGKADIGYDDGVSIMAAFLQPKGTIAFVRNIEKGQTYLIAGGGDDDVEDLDIDVLDQNNRVIRSDTQADNQPVVTFTATYSGRCTIRQTLFTAKRGSFCVVSVLRRGGWKVPKENLIKSAGDLISMANGIDQRAKEQVAFQSGPNQWALYGGIFRKGEHFEINNIGLGTGRRMITAAGDTQAKDIDLYIEVNGKQIKDTAPDATPVIDLDAKNVDTATLKIHNVNSDGPSLILTTLLQLQ